MTPDEAAFVRAIHANPDDNTTRLVYADWLDECGTTDQQAARSEWIRLTCWDTSKEAGKPTGERKRLKGEPAWLRANAGRLWPNLFGSKASWWPRPQSLSLLTGRIVLPLALSDPIANGTGEQIHYTRIGLQAERGITTAVTMTFLRAARLAPAAALDEPEARIQFCSVPESCFEFGTGEMFVHRGPFEPRGLGDVWEATDGGYALVDDHERVKTFQTTFEEPFKVTHAVSAINAALTTWARRKARNPLVADSA